MKHSFILLLIILAILPLNLFSQDDAQTQPQKKIALVIGNGNYASSILANPENDARSMADVLIRLGFTVYSYENLGQEQMKRAIDDFGLKLKGNDVGLFFYAGHGIQSKGYNYLIPVDARLRAEQDVEYDCVPADRILAKMEGSGTKVNIIILDACRNNPFERSWTRSESGKGLAFMDAPSGTLIAYSTSPGSTALDGSGKNSPYTTAILECILNPNVTITQMFQNVGRILIEKTNKLQTPWIASSLIGDFYFNTNNTQVQNAVFQNEIEDYQIKSSTDNISDNIFIDPVENRQYKTVKIGNQIWMAENLKTTKFNDGTPIPLVTSLEAWGSLNTPGYCWFENDENTNKETYGALYNWFTINTGKLCPDGWHVPTLNEWRRLIGFLGGEKIGREKLKETGIKHWPSPNKNATNEVGFTAIPGGWRTDNGHFKGIGNEGKWWTSSTGPLKTGELFQIADNYKLIYDEGTDRKYGYSVRCIKDQ